MSLELLVVKLKNDIIVPLSETFRSNYNLSDAISQLLKSKHFYDADDGDSTNEIIGGMIKTPIDLVLQTLSITNYPVPDAIERGEFHYKNFYYFQIMNKNTCSLWSRYFQTTLSSWFSSFLRSS